MNQVNEMTKAIRKAIVLDTETTDLLAPEAAPNEVQPFITEIYICIIDMDTGEILREFDHLVNIPIEVPEHITRITGITDEMLANKPTFDTLIPGIINICKDVDAVIGQNLMFDLEVIRHNFIRHGMGDKLPQFKEKICTVEMSYPIQKRRMKLGDLYKMATGMVHEGAHRAKADVAATTKVFMWLESEGF